MGKKREPDATVGGGKRPTKQVRLYEPDVEDLGKLSSLRGDDSAADTFRVVFGDLLRGHLIDAVAAEGRRLKNRNPDV